MYFSPGWYSPIPLKFQNFIKTGRTNFFKWILFEVLPFPSLCVSDSSTLLPFSLSGCQVQEQLRCLELVKHKRGKGDSFEEQRPPIRLPCPFLTKRAPCVGPIVVPMPCTEGKHGAASLRRPRLLLVGRTHPGKLWVFDVFRHSCTVAVSPFKSLRG